MSTYHIVPMTITHPSENRFTIPGIIHFEDGPNHLRRMVVRTSHAHAELYLHGAHLTHYQPLSDKKPVLFMSSRSLFDPKKAIRGGVPVIFPWFGSRQDHPSSPAHGFARVKKWKVETVQLTDQGGVLVLLKLNEDEETRATWKNSFSVRYSLHIASFLELSLEVSNTSKTPMTFEEALHTYFWVNDVKKVTVEGLGDTTYLDKVEGFKPKRESQQLIQLCGETDRIYLNTQSTCVINDPGVARRILIGKSGSNTTVLWNPWIEKTKAMNDLGDNEWQNMICIETCNVSQNAITLEPGQLHTMTASIRTEEIKK